jgi:aspartyl-tRNA(Asn)/glutamyl-tRNA(Gln) amidotransferase subunit A
MEAAGADEEYAFRFSRMAEEASADRLNAFITVSSGEQHICDGKLRGVVFGIKDNIAVRGEKLTCASRALENYVAPYDASIVANLRGSGAMILGKTNMDEFACGSSGETSAFGPTLNPIFPGMVPGGSSSGSAAAVAGGLVDAAIGSDTGGSVRCPAAFCGIAAFKPTYGRISRHGLVDMSMSLESPAPIVPRGRTALLADIMDTISGYDEFDQATYGASRTECRKSLDDFNLSGAHLSIPSNLIDLCSSEVRKAFSSAVEKFRNSGARIDDIKLKSASMALPAYYLTMYSEFASAMQRYDGMKFGLRGEGSGVEEVMKSSRSVLGPEVRRRILLGTYITSLEGKSEWYERAMNSRAAIMDEMASVTSSCDMIILPTMPVTPYPFGERLSDPLLMYATDVLTVLPNVCGLPAGCIPLGNGVSLQLTGERNSDEKVVSAMHVLSELMGYG